MSKPLRGPVAQETEEAKSQSVEETGGAANPADEISAATETATMARGPIAQNTEEPKGQPVEETGEAENPGLGIQETEPHDTRANRGFAGLASQSAAARAAGAQPTRVPVAHSEEPAGRTVGRDTGQNTQAGRPQTGAREGDATRAENPRTPALELTATHGATSLHLTVGDPALGRLAVLGGLGALVCVKLDSEQLVRVAQGFGIAAGVAAGVSSVSRLVHLWVTRREDTEAAIRSSLEGERVDNRRDPQVNDIRLGSLLVSVRCFSEKSLVGFIRDFDSGVLKKRLMRELSRVGFEGDLMLTIENREELQNYIAVR